MLISIKNVIHNAIPEAEETIVWGMPTWRKKGNIIHFAVSKNHIGVYVGQEAVDFFKERLQSGVIQWIAEEETRGRGISKKLMEILEQTAMEKGYSELWSI